MQRTYLLKSQKPKEVKLSIIFEAAGGTDDPTVLHGPATVTHSGSTGEYTVTLNDTWKYLRSWSASVQLATVVDHQESFADLPTDLTDLSSFTFVYSVAGSETDMTDGDLVCISLVVTNSSL